MPKIADVKSKSRSKRKPLRDLSNAGFKPPPTNFLIKERNPDTKQQDPVSNSDGDPLRRLLLAHSDLSVLIHQIDELVAQALEQKVRNKKEIESFAQVLCEMQTSLKPWISRFQKVLSTRATEFVKSLLSKKIVPSVNEDMNKALDSPEINKLDFLVSPSPLVSWRADCAAEGGRNLFMLTPVPKPTTFKSKLKESSKLVYEKITNGDTDLNDGVKLKPSTRIVSDPVALDVKNTVEGGFSSPEKLVRRNDYCMVVSTPYLKISPPKSCVLLEPASECCNKNTNCSKNPTMHPPGGDGHEPFGHLALKYPELFGIMPVNKQGNARKVVETSPSWCISPPKTCVLLEPGDDDQALSNLPKAGGVSGNNVIDNTPMCKDFDTTILRGKRPGENTLKKELWMRFDAATTNGVFHVQETPNAGTKGFMELLEEVSSDDTNSIV